MFCAAGFVGALYLAISFVVWVVWLVIALVVCMMYGLPLMLFCFIVVNSVVVVLLVFVILDCSWLGLFALRFVCCLLLV